MVMKPFQTSGVSLPRAQQASALPMQAATIPATATTTSQIDIGEMMNLMITMMIVVMMMKMMSGMMTGIT